MDIFLLKYAGFDTLTSTLDKFPESHEYKLTVVIIPNHPSISLTLHTHARTHTHTQYVQIFNWIVLVRVQHTTWASTGASCQVKPSQHLRLDEEPEETSGQHITLEIGPAATTWMRSQVKWGR